MKMIKEIHKINHMIIEYKYGNTSAITLYNEIHNLRNELDKIEKDLSKIEQQKLEKELEDKHV